MNPFQGKQVSFKDGAGFLSGPSAPTDSFGKENLEKLLEFRREYEECQKLALGIFLSSFSIEY
jgi:hypothetical protein